MTYFKLILGYECGVDKSVCPLGYPEYCPRCIFKRFIDAEFIIDKVETIEQDSDIKRQEMNYRYIWKKYKDILNIRHIIILSNNGVPIYNFAVGDHPIDATLLSGFIQANVLFSSEKLAIADKKRTSEDIYDRKFYEFQYKDFNILLRNGKFCRICLILDNSASSNLRELLSHFIEIFEKIYEDKLKEFEKTGNLELFKSVKKLIEKMFEVNLIYPQTLSAQIPANIIDNFSLIQKAVFEYSNDLLKEKPYFFIPHILDTTARILGIIPREEILWNIYQMLRHNIILSKDLQFQRYELDIRRQEKREREFEIRKILEKKELVEILNESISISIEEAHQKMKFYLKKAEVAKKNSAYQEALNEYEKALVYAKIYNAEAEIGKISFQIIEILRFNKDIELEFAREQSMKAEKKKNYIKTLKYLFEIKDILTSEIDKAKNEKKLIKLNQHIKKIQNLLR